MKAEIIEELFKMIPEIAEHIRENSELGDYRDWMYNCAYFEIGGFGMDMFWRAGFRGDYDVYDDISEENIGYKVILEDETTLSYLGTYENDCEDGFDIKDPEIIERFVKKLNWELK